MYISILEKWPIWGFWSWFQADSPAVSPLLIVLSLFSLQKEHHNFIQGILDFMVPHLTMPSNEPTKDNGVSRYFISSEGIGQALCPASEPHTFDDPEATPALEYPDQALHGHLKQIW